MKIVYFTILFFVFTVVSIKAQSYLYNKNSSGPAFSYSRILGANGFALDFTYKGRFSVGATLVGLNKRTNVYGINGVLNMLKKENRRNVVSLPVLVGYQSVNNKSLISYGAGFYIKSFAINHTSTAAGISYVRSKTQNAFSNNYTGQVGFELVLFYKSLKLGPTILLGNDGINFGFSAGFAFNHNNTFFSTSEMEINDGQ